jgi:flavin-dependent dehydrogenase
MDYDVVIVGGSLAGSAAATLYGRAGLRVAVVEKHSDPRAYKTTVLTVLPAKHRLPEFKADLERSFMRSFEGLPRGPRLDRAQHVSKIMGKLDLTNVRRRPAARGMA